jgi:flagellum-specific peptidoglycan hydrolase FlgJ
MPLKPEQKQWLDLVSQAAENAAHIFPTMAACEAALESGYGNSGLAKRANNLFGMKAHKTTPLSEVLTLPTKEFLNGKWVTVNANWMQYATLSDCFADRMATLTRLSKAYPHYGAALAAPDAETFLREVSITWSTDPKRAEKVQAIHDAYIMVTP